MLCRNRLFKTALKVYWFLQEQTVTELREQHRENLAQISVQLYKLQVQGHTWPEQYAVDTK